MSRALKKAVLIAFLAGFMIPCLLELAGIFAEAISVQPGLWWSNVVIWIWPTGIALMETSNDWKGYVMFAATAVLNGMLYAFVVFIIGYVVQAFREPWV